MKRPLMVLAAVLILGISYGERRSPDAFIAGLLFLAGVGGLTAFRVRKRRESLRTVWILPILTLTFLVSAGCSVSRCVEIEKRLRSVPDQEPVLLTGVVTSSEKKNGNVRFVLSQGKLVSRAGFTPKSTGKTLKKALGNHQKQTEKQIHGSVLIYTESDTEIPPGTRVTVSGTAQRLRSARNPGNFDEQSFYLSRGISLTVYAEEFRTGEQIRSPRFFLSRSLAALHGNLNRVYEKALPGEEAGLLSSMALGSRDSLSGDVKSLFQTAGIIHLLSVSGTHIHVISSSLYKRMKGKGFGLYLSAAVSSGIALLYGMLCGNSVSTRRAVGMFLILTAGDVLGRAYDTLTALSVMAAAILIRNPFAAEDAGFLFSFGAVAALVVFQGPVTRAYFDFCQRRWERTYRRKAGEHFVLSLREHLFSGALSSAVIQLATLPLAAALFYEVPVYVLFLNLLVLPLFPVLLTTALLGGLLCLLLPLYILLLPCHWILFFYEWAADAFSSLPGAQLITGQPGLWIVLAYYSLLFLLVRSFSTGSFRKWKLGVCFLLTGFILFRLPEPFRIDVLDCGQGEAIRIHDREAELFLDGGSTDVKKAGTYRLLPYLKQQGVRSIDYWLISHTDMDHISGLMEVLESGYLVKTLIAPRHMPEDDQWKELEALAERAGTEILRAAPGDRLRAGETTLTFLYPGNGKESVEDRNEACLAFLLEHGDFTGIFTGDLGMEGEAEILSEWQPEQPLDLVKIGHHGSETSTSPEWLDTLQPGMAVISCGKDNSYGHPSKKTLKKLKKRGIPYFITMDSGMIRITPEKGRVKVREYISP